MLLALFSDIHANIHAFDTCLAHARAQGATQFAILGDSVGYGAFPGEVVDRVMSLHCAGAIAIKGNHDVLACIPSVAMAVVKMDEAAAIWTRDQLNAEQKQFLAELPMTARWGDCLLVHASADAPERWRYVTDTRSAGVSLASALAMPGVRHVFGGHVHNQSLYYLSAGNALMQFTPTSGVCIPMPKQREWLATVGSLGQPRDGDTRAMYAMYDADRPSLTFWRVRYDHLAAAAAIRHTGQSEFFAQRLEDGR